MSQVVLAGTARGQTRTAGVPNLEVTDNIAEHSGLNGGWWDCSERFLFFDFLVSFFPPPSAAIATTYVSSTCASNLRRQLAHHPRLTPIISTVD